MGRKTTRRNGRDRRYRARRAPCILLLASVFMTGLMPQAMAEVDLSGDFSTSLGIGLGESFDAFEYEESELRLGLRLEVESTNNLRLFSEAWVRSGWDFPALYEDAQDFSASNPFDFESLMPVAIELREAYADLYGFPFPATDVRIGRQRIAWGTADRISVVDNLNPDDLGDFWDFGRHAASGAASLTLYWNQFSVQGVYIPVFKPAVLPAQASTAAAAVLPDISPLTLNSLTADYSLPADDPLANACFGLRARLNILGWDAALSYVLGREDFPRPESVSAVFHTPGVDVDVEVVYGYPRLHVGGVELFGELFGLGVWGEAALFWPEYTTVIDTSAIGGFMATETNEWYLKAVAGLDYTFPFGLYVNLQYAHGLAYENRRDGLQDYLILAAEWLMPGGRVKIGPIGAALEVDDFSQMDDSWALALSPEIGLLPADNVELALGMHWIEAREGTTLGLQTAGTELTIRGKLSF